MKVIFTRDFLALILSVAVVGLGSGATLPLTALALTQAGYGTDVVGLLMQFTSNLWLWAVLRVLCGAALMLLFTISEAWVNQLADDATRGRVIAIYATTFTLFQMSGPVLVSQIADFMHGRFLMCGAIFLLALPTLASIRKTPHASEDEHAAHGSWRHVLPQMPALVIGCRSSPCRMASRAKWPCCSPRPCCSATRHCSIRSAGSPTGLAANACISAAV
jgi:MFS family permease